ncbi:MAG: aryldialkylphosphatase [Proteobacteria bacterium]|nr:aryldialkylphosphatase [Pseudomonadota bacterium]
MGSAAMKGYAQTVLGPVRPEELGLTMMHEHLLTDLTRILDLPDSPEERALSAEPVVLSNLSWAIMNGMRSRDNLVLDNREVAVMEAGVFKKAGGGTIVDVTTVDLGRNPLALRDIAERTGLHIVMATGYYTELFHPADMGDRSEADIAAEIASDVIEGVGDTGVRAGIIGELGCSWPLRPDEAKVLRAGARAQRETGAPITIHPGRHIEAPFEILDVLDKAGADIGRVIMGHMERTNLPQDRLLQLARVGCYLEYDWFGEVRPTFAYGRSDQYIVDKQFAVDVPSDGERLKTLAWLISQGFEDRILVSQDVCFKTRLTAYGGVGYAHIAKYVRRWMPEMGIAPDAIEKILFLNPRRVLQFA